MDTDKESRNSYQEDTGIFGNLADHEDYQGNLSRVLKRMLDGRSNLVLLEAGAGLGRHIPDYLERCRSVYLTDLSASMIDECREKYKDRKNMHWFQMDHGVLGSIPVREPVDVVLGTYTFGHYICASDTPPEKAYQHLIREFLKIRHTEDAVIIIVEVGSIDHNDLSGDPRLGEYYACLTRDFGTPESISTDFQFNSVQEAVHIMGGFFGKEAGESVLKAHADTMEQKVRIPESTLLWRAEFSALQHQRGDGY